MNLVLKGFSEDVNLEDPRKPHFYLVFDDNGKEYRLPTEQRTVEALMDYTLGKKKESAAPARERNVEEEVVQHAEQEMSETVDDEFGDATQFSMGSVDQDEEELEKEPEEEENGTPESEDEVPGL